jgi:BirA family biotin operon repressor/biotin-[acetyl-CoA-carboxylase] ligase
VTTSIRVDRLQENLKTKRLGRNIFFSHEIGSTNVWAKELATYGAVDGAVTIAETQTAGHGRLGREWISPEGGLWFSVILRPKLRVTQAAKLVFVAGLAVARVLHEMYRLTVEVKWPNDVLVNGKKICGILLETNATGEAVNFVVVGIGINANFDANEAFPEKYRTIATSLESELGRRIRLEGLFKALLEELETVYDLYIQRGFAMILEQWKKYARFLGKKVEVTSKDERLTGLAYDVSLEGALILRFEDGTTRPIFAGDVTVRTE